MDPLNLTFLEDRGYGTIIPFFWANENAKLTPEYTGTLILFYAFYLQRSCQVYGSILLSVSVLVRVLHHFSHQSRLSIINCGYMDIVDILGEI